VGLQSRCHQQEPLQTTTHCSTATLTAGNTTTRLASYLVTEHPSITPFFMSDYSVTTHRHSSTSFIRHPCHCSSLPRKSSSTHPAKSYTSPSNHQPHQHSSSTFNRSLLLPPLHHRHLNRHLSQLTLAFLTNSQ